MCPDGRGTRRVLTGWGRTAPTGADVVVPLGADEVATHLEGAATARGTVARGLGRSYGDAAQNAGGTVLDMTSLRGIQHADLDRGRIEVDAGVSLGDIMRWTVPRGWFPTVTPGTRFVTVGGAIAADIHGKNHHIDGTFTASVDTMTLHTPQGDFDLTPDDELFWATAGGMGLTGVVTRATVELTPVDTAYMRVDTERAGDLDDLMARMSDRDDDYRYSVAWIDCLATGKQLGRGVLTRGDHATIGDLPTTLEADPLSYEPTQPLAAPPWAPDGLLNRLTVRAFNELWFRKAPQRRTSGIQSIPTFFHPLDAVKGWNRMYGSSGFLQYQFVVPLGHESALQGIIERLADAQVASFLAVLKRFGPSNQAPLSFPIEGWTLALDLPVHRQSHILTGLLASFDRVVAEAGGRVYLAKDARLDPELLPVMYPDLDRWRQIRDRVDPDHTLTSDLDRRLDLTGRNT